MRKHLFIRIVSWVIVLAMVLPFVPAARASEGITWKETDAAITAQLPDREIKQNGSEPIYADSERVRVSIVLEEPSTVDAGYATMDIAGNGEAMTYSQKLHAQQKQMEKTISARALNGGELDVVWNMTLVGNIISAWVPYGSIGAIEDIPGVREVALEAKYEPCEAQRVEAEPAAYTSSGMIGSGVLWEQGLTGAGARIAIVDTGTDTEHQSFDNGAYLYALAENAAEKGMSAEAYRESLDLLTAEDIAAVLPEMNLYELDPDVDLNDLYLSEKLAFGYNYVDGNLNIDHDDDYQGEHGSHVAGISAANRYIPSGSGYEATADTVLMQGVAPDAQLITMKVFGEESPYDSDYMAAIEDAILLGCDAVNLSMGSTAPGSPYNRVYAELLEKMTRTDTVVVISAGNAANWAETSMFGYLYNDDVSFNEVGEPGSYASAFTVASVDNGGSIGFRFNANGVDAFYVETLDYGNTAMSALDNSLDLDGTEYEYVFLDGLGYEEEYEGIDVTGKVVLVSRGTLNFAVKANNALSRGAVAVVVYNNEPGVSNMDLTGLSYAAPVVSITQAEGAAIRAVSEDRGTHLTGRLTVYGKMDAVMMDSEYYTMSEFSSWGVPGNLTLKPEITAPGGGIYSVWGSNLVTGGGSDQYETMSGTSMSAPQVTGMAALLSQYFEESGIAEANGISPRHLAQSLLMSTAEPLLEKEAGGNYYSLLNQGAGLARVDLAAAAESYLLVDGQSDGKVKAELGDDPERTGVYSFSFTITNMSGRKQTYALEADAFRQDVFEYMENSDVWLLDTRTTELASHVTFTADVPLGFSGPGLNCDLNGDGVTNTADADFLLEHLVGSEPELKADGDLSGDGVVNSYDAHLLLAGLSSSTVTVPAGSTVTIGVELALTAEARAELDAETPKGTYVQAFVYAREVSDAEGSVGTTHSIPVLAFYGDWSEPSMFDRGTLIEHIYLAVNTGPYLYYIIGPYGNSLGIDYGDGTEYYYGGNPIVDDAAYLPQRNAFNSVDSSRITEQTFTLIRGAGAARMQISNADTGEVYLEKQLGELYPAYYNASSGGWENTIQYASLNWSGTDAAGQPLAEGTRVNISLTAVPHYYRESDGSYPFDGLGAGSTMTTSLTIDNTAPKASDISTEKLDSGILTVTARDNEYVAAVALLNAQGTKFVAAQSPNQTERSTQVTVELDLSSAYGKNFLVAVYDYAGNVTTYEVELELGSAERPYFTAINYNTGTYVGIDDQANLTDLADVGIPTMARAAEYVEGHVFLVSEDNMLCVADDEDLYTTRRIAELDPKNELLIDAVADMAYNRADGKLYALIYSLQNNVKCPYLCTIDLDDGTIEVLCEMVVNVHALACDSEGTFYAAAYNAASLYSFTAADAAAGKVSYVGEMGYYSTSTICSMAWDHRADKLYFAYPNSLLEINPKTAEPTHLGYYTAQVTGLYIRDHEGESPFAPTHNAQRIELNYTDTRVMEGGTLPLTATVWPWYVSDGSVTWTSSDETVATVDANGVVTGVSQGSCTITATSNLDPSLRASCAIEVFRMEKVLNALIWDENGEIWMSRFSTETLPEYTKLHSKDLGKDLAAATITDDGTIYAASLDVDTLKSELYRLDGETFEPTLIGQSTDGYVDLAPAPGMPGESLLAVYGGNVLHVDATTGDYYNYYYMFQYNLVAAAYIGTVPYQDYGYDTMVDWYFLIDRIGYVYLMGFLEQDGAYYYLEHDALAPGGVYTELGFEMDTPYFGSAYFDGEFLFFSAYRQSRDNVTLMAIDVAGGSRACYELGTFEAGVWPVAGLMELGTVGGGIDVILGRQPALQSQPVRMEQGAELAAISVPSAGGALNAALETHSDADVKPERVTVSLTLPSDAPNGAFEIRYDAKMMELVAVDGRTTAFAWTENDGVITLAFAEAEAITAGTAAARLTFEPRRSGDTAVTIVTQELGDGTPGSEQTLNLTLLHDCPSAGFADVPQNKWYHEAVDYVVEQGYMNGMDATHFGPNQNMTRAQFVTVLYRMVGSPSVTAEHQFTDVQQGRFYTDAVAWAVANGITSGKSTTVFDPNGKLTRSELVTFLYRYAKLKGYDTTATADVNTFSDGALVPKFSRTAWSWALTNGMITGMGANTLAPTDLTTRAQAATLFQRLDSTFA